jgi:hypothetical protein
MTRENIAGTATAITLLSIPVKCFVQLVMEKAKIPSLIRFGVARATTGLVKNATAFVKRLKKEIMGKLGKVKVNSWNDVLLQICSPVV